MVNSAREFEAALVRQCAPTLAGLKPGSIFCVKASLPEFIRSQVRHWDVRLKPLGLSVRILLERSAPGPTIVYVCRRTHLERVLFSGSCRRFLERAGYQKADLDGLLEQLSRQLRTQLDFPHEIGVFLGYPVRDVIGFIENRGQNFTCCGFWKSYSDPEQMESCFACYRRCVHTYMRLFEQGISIEKLAVAA